ncbi:HalD/BesD family halogenase [Janibacter indicus]
MTDSAVLAEVVDLDRYPIHELDSERGRAFVEACQRELDETGVCALDGFIRPAAVARMVELAGEIADQAWPTDRSHTIYFTEPDTSVDDGHPLRREVRSAKHGYAYDRIPTDAPVRRLYESDELTAFIAAVLRKDPLYRSADPLDAFQVTAFHPGEELGWHFDNSEFSMTVMYQPAEEGGEFVYVPRLRSEADDNHEGIRRVLDGDESDLVTLPSGPGSLAFFRGEHALHRVTPVGGSRPRINSVLTYGVRPDMRLSDLTSQIFYGRTSR